MDWVFDESGGNALIQGGAEFDTSLSNQDGHQETSLFMRESIANSYDQRLLNNSKPVRVYVDVITLSGDSKEKFRNSLNWKVLKDHILSCATQPNQIKAHSEFQSYARKLSSNSENDKINLVRISDYNSSGLCGDEFGNDNDMSIPQNFNLFCRARFQTTHGAGQRRQGSYGIGKSVFYKMSGINTVLMSSRPIDSPNKIRMFGRSELPSHKLKDILYQGAGCFGKTGKGNANRPASLSVFNPNTIDLENLFLHRPDGDETGTTVLSACFLDDFGKSHDSIIPLFEDDIKKWFWPGLCQDVPKIEIYLRAFNGENMVSSKRVQLNEYWKPFVQALKNEVDETLSKRFSFDVPVFRNTDEVDTSSTPNGCTAYIDILIKQTSNENDSYLGNKLALMRNDLCVVDYKTIPNSKDGAMYGVLIAGTARGETLEDRALHDFLRDAEPPLHNHWKYKEKIINKYNCPKNILNQFDNLIDVGVRELVINQESQSTDNLEHLSHFFKFGNAGSVSKPKDLSFEIVEPSVTGHILNCKYLIKNLLVENNKEWKIVIENRIKNVNTAKLEIIDCEVSETDKLQNYDTSNGKLKLVFDAQTEKCEVIVETVIPEDIFTKEECKQLNFVGFVTAIKD